jgi:hypothetical protein
LVNHRQFFRVAGHRSTATELSHKWIDRQAELTLMHFVSRTSGRKPNARTCNVPAPAANDYIAYRPCGAASSPATKTGRSASHTAARTANGKLFTLCVSVPTIAAPGICGCVCTDRTAVTANRSAGPFNGGAPAITSFSHVIIPIAV